LRIRVFYDEIYIRGLSGLALTAPATAHLVLHVYMYIGIQDYNRVIAESAL